MLPPEIQGIIFMSIGLACVVIGRMQINKRKNIIANGVEVDGVVFDTIYEGYGDESFEYPIIRFVTKKDMLWITEKYEVSITGFMNKGEKVRVVYDATNPKNFIVKTSFDTSLFFYALPVIGLVLFIIGGKMVFDYLMQGN
ncbi:MAG: DUF3592 domain-containing protein [Chitinophagaceae bacterium]